MIKDTDEFNDTISSMSQKKLAFIIRALMAAGHVSQYTVEKAVDLADTITE